MSLATQLLGWIKSRPARVGRAFKTKHPVVFNHMGVAAPLLLLIGWLVIYASVVLDILPDFADPIEAVLLGAKKSACVEVAAADIKYPGVSAEQLMVKHSAEVLKSDPHRASLFPKSPRQASKKPRTSPQAVCPIL